MIPNSVKACSIILLLSSLAAHADDSCQRYGLDSSGSGLQLQIPAILAANSYAFVLTAEGQRLPLTAKDSGFTLPDANGKLFVIESPRPLAELFSFSLGTSGTTTAFADTDSGTREASFINQKVITPLKATSLAEFHQAVVCGLGL